jgi:hypothetical protein
MIELVVSMQGLLILNGMHAQTMTPAAKPLTVITGTAHPPTFVTPNGGFGYFDEGDYPPTEPTESWVEGVFGMPSAALLPRRRVNVVDRGSGIAIQVHGTVVELEIRSSDGTRVERRRWAGSADFDVNGAVQQADMDAFMDDFEAGDSAADFNRDGRITDADRTAFEAAWEQGGPAPCSSDLTLDGQIDITDLLAYLDSWFDQELESDLAEPAGEVDIEDLLAY